MRESKKKKRKLFNQELRCFPYLAYGRDRPILSFYAIAIDALFVQIYLS